MPRTTREGAVRNALPTPSAEQRRILDSLRADACVQCMAEAGAGKTTTGLLAVLMRMEPSVIVTFSKALQIECQEKLVRYGLDGFATAKTFHSLLGTAAGVTIPDNDTLLFHLRQWRSGAWAPQRVPERFVVLDELQDLCPLVFEALTYVLPEDALFLVVGDAHQMIYDFRRGDEKATSVYLERAPEHFAEHSGGRPWHRHELRLSYRLTPNLALFANVAWGTRIVAGNTTSENRPVEYLYLDPWNTGVLARLFARIIDEAGGLEHVLVLAQKVSDGAGGQISPLTRVINELQTFKDARGRRKYNFSKREGHENSEAADARLLKNKVRLWTVCSSKGSEAHTVILWAPTMFDPDKVMSVNQLGVALTRSRCRLVIVHGKDARRPVDYHPCLSAATLKDLRARGVVTLPQGVPPHAEVGRSTHTELLWATDLCHTPAATLSSLLAPFAWEESSVPEAGMIPLETTAEFQTGAHSTVESLGALYGVAMPLALEDARTGRLTQVDGILDPLCVAGNHVYAYTEVMGMLAAAGVVDVPEALKVELRELGTTSGRPLLSALRRHALRRADGQRVSVYERARYDVAFKAHLPELRRVHSERRKTPGDYMMLANAVQAYGNCHHLLHQVGDYAEWVDVHAFETGVARLDAAVGPGARFEVECTWDWTPAVRGGSGKRYVGVGARVDALVEDEVHEFKFSRERATSAHKVQALVGACVVAADRGRAATCVLHGYRRGEILRCRVTPAEAVTFLETIKAAVEEE